MNIALEILGQPVSMKNGRQIVTNKATGKKMSIKSPEALQYEEDFLKQVPGQLKICIDEPVKVSIVAYYASRKPDLDCELICDLLQKSGILKNDRLIHEKHFIKRLDRDNPRCDIRISGDNSMDSKSRMKRMAVNKKTEGSDAKNTL